MKTIVALVDFSDVASRVLEQAGEQAKAFGARVILMHVVPKEAVVIGFGIASPVVMEAPTEQRIKMDLEKLEVLRASLTERGVDVLMEQVTEGTAERLLEECRMWKADLIVLGSHHHSTVFKWFFGTFTTEVLKSANCPVLVVPAESETQ
jgi:nucleotide-binding universal stress UspA family protein